MQRVFLTHTLLIPFFVAPLFLVVRSQTTHIVTVGLEGSFFTPPTLSAQVNDTVSFVFAGYEHTVTQCAYQTPCVPLAGGFSSGLAGRGANDTPPPVWNLQITNASEPIWFFCEVTAPASHCASGMVGVINPPSIQTYNQFVSAAKVVTGTSAPSLSPALSGQGAFATALPMPSSSSVTGSPTLSSSAASYTSLPPSHQAAIIGGSLGGALVLLGVFTAFLILRYRRSKTSHRTDFFFTDQSAPVYRSKDKTPHAGTRLDKGHEIKPSPSASHTLHADSPSIPVLDISPIDSGRQALPFSDVHESTSPTSSRKIRPLPRTPPQQNFVVPDVDGHAEDSSASSLTDLAREVATVLLETPPRRRDPPSSWRKKVQYHETEKYTKGSGDGDIPPEYRAA